MLVLAIAFVILLLLGAPIFVVMAGSSTLSVLLSGGSMPSMLLAQRMQYAVDSFPQLAIPFFILAGHFMNVGGISQKIVDFCSALVGHIKGGLAQVMILASMLFAGISGSAYADASMLGTALLPTMKKKGYPVAESTVILAAGSTIGPIIPPSIQMVIFSVTASASVGKMLMGGVLPGITMGICLMIIAFFRARKQNWPREQKADGKQIWTTFKGAIWALLMPVIIVGGIVGGVFTATEAAVIASVYAFTVGKFVYKKLTFKDVFPIMKKTFLQTAQVTIIISAAGILGWLMTKNQIPAKLSAELLSITNSKVVLLLLINLILLILGCFMETTAIVLLITPVFLPIINSLGMNVVHFGVFMLLNLCIGLITPPVGMCMYIGCGISKCTIGDFCKKLPPYFIALIVALLITTFWEPLTMFLPSFLGR